MMNGLIERLQKRKCDSVGQLQRDAREAADAIVKLQKIVKGLREEVENKSKVAFEYKQAMIAKQDALNGLHEENAQLRRERDAAVADFETVCKETEDYRCCSFCKKQFTNCEKGCNPEWRGVQEGNA